MRGIWLTLLVTAAALVMLEIVHDTAGPEWAIYLSGSLGSRNLGVGWGGIAVPIVAGLYWVLAEFGIE